MVFFRYPCLAVDPRRSLDPRLAGGLIDTSGTMSGGGGKVASGGMRPGRWGWVSQGFLLQILLTFGWVIESGFSA